MRLGQTLGGLLNASFGNAVEIIVGIAALVQGELRIVQTSMLGSVLSNLLLVLGMSFFVGGVYFHEQNFRVTAAQTGASLMTLACITLVIPAAYHSSQQHSPKPPVLNAISALMETDAPGGNDLSHNGLLLISRGTAVILLIVYISYLFFQANAAEHVTAVWMAMKGKLELTIGISVGSSIQIAAFVVPLLVIVSWVIGKELTLYFADFETVALFVSVILVNLLIMDGKSNYMEGLMCCALYIVIALAFWVS
ncbi:hypothetical protein FRC11_000455 [Ceratobasidium sp. 423]|nr:hypothetical protein FRC11_000455 [Ceratobasidium sp. 423]